jgi:hypothetical protein
MCTRLNVLQGQSVSPILEDRQMDPKAHLRQLLGLLHLHGIRIFRPSRARSAQEGTRYHDPDCLQCCPLASFRRRIGIFVKALSL